MFLKIIFSLALIFLQGCSSNTWDRGKEITTKIISPMPNYSINDVFIFTNGYIERVSDINGDIIDWEVSGGTFNYKAYNNFTLPLISWETKTKKGYNEMSVLNKQIMWPLTPGEDYRLGLKKTSIKKTWHSVIVSFFKTGIAKPMILGEYQCQLEHLILYLLLAN